MKFTGKLKFSTASLRKSLKLKALLGPGRYGKLLMRVSNSLHVCNVWASRAITDPPSLSSCCLLTRWSPSCVGARCLPVHGPQDSGTSIPRAGRAQTFQFWLQRGMRTENPFLKCINENRNFIRPSYSLLNIFSKS